MTTTRHVRSAGRPSLLAGRPEIAPIATTVLAWAALIAVSPLSSLTTLGGGPLASDTGGQPVGHGAHGIFTPAGLSMVAVMTAAMMAPLAIPGVRAVTATSAGWRAGRAGLWFFVTYLVTWTVFGVCLAPIAEMLAGVLGSATLAAGILTVACAPAQFDPRRTRLTGAGDRPIRLPSGPTANADCARSGLSTASRGLRFCALPMLAMFAVPNSLLVMALLTALTVIDWLTGGSRRLPIAGSYLFLAAVLLITA